MKNGYVLLNLIVGSRGSFTETFGSDFNFRQILYFGDERDGHGGFVKYPPHGTTSGWPYKCFVDKLFRFQWEALELLFGHPTNFVEFDPVLLPLWNARNKLICHEMIDKVAARATRQVRRAFRSAEKGSKRKEYLYDPIQVIRAFDILQSCRFAAETGSFCPQVAKWLGDIRQRVLAGEVGRKKIIMYLNMTVSQLKNLQLDLMRAPTKREMYRGEEPASPIPSVLNPVVKKELRSICERVWSDIRGGKIGRKMSEEELAVLTGGELAMNSAGMDPEYNPPPMAFPRHAFPSMTSSDGGECDEAECVEVSDEEYRDDVTREEGPHDMDRRRGERR